jgi:hypothetical protein
VNSEKFATALRMTDKKGRTDLVASAMRHKHITLLLVVMMMLAGLFSLVKIPKNEFPQFNVHRKQLLRIRERSFA